VFIVRIITIFHVISLKVSYNNGLLFYIMVLTFLVIPRNGVGVSEIEPDPRDGMHTHSATNKTVTSSSRRQHTNMFRGSHFLVRFE